MADTRVWRHLYGRARWRRLREYQLACSPLCAYCARQEIVTEAEVVDHILPHKGDETLFYDPENLQSLCKQCHDSTKALEEHGKTVIRFGADGYPISD